MPLRLSPSHSHRWVEPLWWGGLVALGLAACGPRPSQKNPVGVSRYDDPTLYGLGGAEGQDPTEAASAATGGTASGGSASGGTGSGGTASGGSASAGTGGGPSEPPPDPAALAAAREAKAREGEDAFAAVLLERAVTPTDSSGLVFALGQRASDLPWTAVLANRGQTTMRVAADPNLLRFELKDSDGSAEPEPPAAPPAAKSGKTAATGTKSAAPRPIVCGPAQAPKSVDEEARLELAPGEHVVYSFDPRSLCSDPGLLTKGKFVHASYGFPVEVRKVWSKGKSTEVPQLDKPPFVAVHPEADPPVPAPALPTSKTQKPSKAPASEQPGEAETAVEHLPKQLTAAPFELDETYPLEGVGAEPRALAADGTPLGPNGERVGSGEPGANGAGAGAKEPPPPPLTLTVSPLGTVSEIDETTVQFTVKNQSGKSLLLFLRRELVAYEILGPRGSSTCRMHPAGRAPDKASYETLGAGGSRSLVTRLAEACPPDTFAQPGTYAVSARLEARSSGDEFGLSAFVGDIATTRPARFVVRGKTGSRSSTFRPAGPQR